MTPQLEKVFFNYILNNHKYYEVVKPYFFRNSEIQLVYGIIKNYIDKTPDAKTPSNRQILDMVTLEDKEGIITKDILKSILKVDLSEYDEQSFILPNFNAWILSNRLKTMTVDIISETRNLDNITEFDKTVEAADKIKSIVDEMSSTNFIQDNDDLGSDFDDPENHIQDSSKFKVKCGFESIDHMLGGGWDIATLNIIMAATNNGKCFFNNTKCTFRNKDNNYIFSEEIEKIFTNISNRRMNI
jgi:replicative DNA helicase